MPKQPKSEVSHPALEAGSTWSRHLAEYSDMCPVCRPLQVRARDVTAFHKSLVEFGYAGLTRGEVEEAYDLAINPKHVLAPEDSIITRLIRTQLAEAGLVVVEE